MAKNIRSSENDQNSHQIYQKRIERMLDDYNQRIGKWVKFWGIVISLVFILLSFFGTIYFNETTHTLSMEGIWQILYKYYLLLILIPFIVKAVSKVQIQNYWIFKNIILYAFIKALIYLLTISIILYFSFIIFSPNKIGLDDHSFLQFSPLGLDYYIVALAIVFFISFVVILLPKFLLIKTSTNKDLNNYPWIYWLYFFRSQINTSPFLRYLVPFMLIFMISVTSFLPFIITTDGNTILKSSDHVESFSILFSVISVFVSLGIILFNELFRNYNRIYQCYEEYSTYQLHKYIFVRKEIKTIIIGFGNLSRIVLGNKIRQIIKEPLILNNLKILIDKNYKIRVIPKDIIVIERDSRMFEEIRTDSNSGLSFGFFNGSDIIPSNITDSSNIKDPNNIDQITPIELAFFAINGDGGDLSLLHNANLDESSLVINTTSDPDMSYRLKHAVENANAEPTIITTVEDSKTGVFLEENSESSFFPLHTSQIEGTLIGLRLYSYYRKNKTKETEKNTVIEKDVPLNIVIIGNGKALYYTIETLRLYLLKDNFNSLQREKAEFEVMNLLNTEITLITDDQHIMSETYLDSSRTFGLKKQWDLYFPKKGRLSLDIFIGNPDKYNVLANAWSWIEKKNNEHTIFVVSSISTNNTLRILENIRQLISSESIKDPSVLTSVAVEASKKVGNILNKMEFLNKPDKHGKKYFPSSFDDFTIKKNGIIGSQINSIANSVSSYSNANSSGELIFCMQNKPGAYVKLLANLSQLKNISSSNSNINGNKWFPSVLFSYTYPLISEEENLKESFVVRADMILLEKEELVISNENNINSYCIIGSKTAREEIEDRITTAPFTDNLNSICDQFSHRCPINPKDIINKIDNIKSNPVNKSGDLAMVKIWAEKEQYSGALALALCDFLMVGENLELPEEKDLKDILNIAFDSCQLCHFEQNMISRVYVKNEKVNKEMVKGVSEMIKKRNIRAIKVKLVKESNDWIKYLNSVKDLMNLILKKENNENSYNIEISDEIVIIYRNDIWSSPVSNLFIKNEL